MRTSYLPAFSAAALAAAALVAPHATAAELAPKGEASCTLTMTAAERAYADSFKSEEKDLGGKRIAGTWVRACLLYTSPSPRDATLSRMPSSA